MRCRADAASNRYPAQCSAAANLAVIEGMRSAESTRDEIRAALLVYVNRVFFLCCEDKSVQTLNWF